MWDNTDRPDGSLTALASTSSNGQPTGIAASNPPPQTIMLNSNAQEMLRISPDGFYVRGEKVPEGEGEAKQIYEAFLSFLSGQPLPTLASNYLDRLRQEEKNLADKLDKLGKFIRGSSQYGQLSYIDQCLLQQQEGVMQMYQSLLKMRLYRATHNFSELEQKP